MAIARGVKRGRGGPAGPGRFERLEVRRLLAAALGPDGTLTVTGTGVGDTVALSLASDQVVVSTNGVVQQFPVGSVARINVATGEGDDAVVVGEGVIGVSADGGGGNDTLTGGGGDDTLTGGPGDDVLDGRAGNDRLESRDGLGADVVDGGPGDADKAPVDSYDTYASIEYLNPFTLTADNPVKTVKVLVLAFNPLVPSEGNVPLWQALNFADPRRVVAQASETIRRVSGGAVDYQIAEFRDLNAFPPMLDGLRYNPDEYVRNRRSGTGWQHADSTALDSLRIMAEQDVAPLINSGAVDEIWTLGDHFFPVGFESMMVGPGGFWINGPNLTDIPIDRAVTVTGGSYEGGFGLHAFGHRFEGTMNHFYGDWNLADPQNNWDKFSANYTQSGGRAGVGTVHFPANADADYDTFNTRVVQSWATTT